MRRICFHFLGITAWVLVVAFGYWAISWLPVGFYRMRSGQLAKNCVQVANGTRLADAIERLNGASPTIEQFNKVNGADQVSFGNSDSVCHVTFDPLTRQVADVSAR